ncbi:hypothetical protein [Mycolicibacter arupensis]|uniref:hypothetical protein n=1 Tax=Mycolicibacter arupensis TaxID=342002 RepID=UPI000A88689D|nr:hypothetical protein [Mycolicibacter arupensis]
MTTAPNLWPSPLPSSPPRHVGKVLPVLTFIFSLAALIAAIAAFARLAPQPTYTTAEKSAAQERLCGQYQLAARAAHIETALDGDTALARISMINAALILETASSDQALASNYRDAARALADAYQTMAATASLGDATKFQAAVDATNTQVETMKALCGD